MITVGVDPSLTCSGMALIDTRRQVVHTWRAQTKRTGSTLRDTRTRLRLAVARCMVHVPARVDVTVIEVPHSAHQYGAQNERVALYWWLVDQFMARGPVVQVAPSQRAKLATGRGNAGKADVVAAVRDAFPDIKVPDDNVADALAMAWAGARRVDPAAVPEFTVQQMVAFRAVDWSGVPFVPA